MMLKKIVDIVVNVFLIAVILFLIYANVMYYIYDQVVLAVVKGISMYPLLRENDIVIIVPSKDISLGDVIVFKNDRNEFVIHRTIAIATCSDGDIVYITKGDNNIYVDSHILSGVAYITSRECHIDDIKILKGYESHVKSVTQGNVIRGIPIDRVAGKALSISTMVVKITGLTPL
ncbi:MAG: signal peptidase I [Ignisphaera sp.]|uniref:Signal peptidase I n=1 Tax=Ignisphaera aggregans TaxID=334771 RepID=A0A7J3MZT0_9CREN